MKKWGLICASAILVVSFQNCSPSQLHNPDSPNLVDQNSNSSPSTSASGEYSVASAEKIAIPNSRQTGIDGVEDFLIHLETGVVTAYVEGQPDADLTYCLKDEELVELKSILSGARVCPATTAPREADVLCAMVYTPAYAALIGADFDVALGEKVDSCAPVVDLCEEHDKLLKGAITHIAKSLHERRCEFEEVE